VWISTNSAINTIPQLPGSTAVYVPVAYTKNFDLTGIDPSKVVMQVSVLADDVLQSIEINGVSINMPTPSPSWVVAANKTFSLGPYAISGLNNITLNVMHVDNAYEGIDCSIDMLKLQ